MALGKFFTRRDEKCPIFKGSYAIVGKPLESRDATEKRETADKPAGPPASGRTRTFAGSSTCVRTRWTSSAALPVGLVDTVTAMRP